MTKKILFALLLVSLSACATEAGKKLKVLQPAIESVDNSYEACVSGISDSAAILPMIDTRVPENLLNNAYFTAEQVKLTSQYMTQEFSCFSNNIGKLEGIDENEMQILVVAYAEALTKSLDYLEGNRNSVTIGAFNRALSGMKNERSKFSDEIVQETVSKLVKEDNAERAAFAAGIAEAMQAGQQRNQTNGNPFRANNNPYGRVSPYSRARQSTPAISNPKMTCQSKGEQRTRDTKQCLYDCLGNTHVKTIRDFELCPLDITVDF